MAGSRIPGPLNHYEGWPPARIPGPLGINDQGDPNVTTLAGDTPGPLGFNDYSDPNLPTAHSLSSVSTGTVVRTTKGAPVAVGYDHGKNATTLSITGVIVEGGPLNEATIAAVNTAAGKTPSQWRRYIAFDDVVKVGGSLAWRANNPGNLRDAPNKIGQVSGAIGHFAVFANMKDGRSAQRDLYINKYGAFTVRNAINKLTPPSENDTSNYLTELKKAGIDLDMNVSSQIDILMPAIEANEGLIEGIEVLRVP